MDAMEPITWLMITWATYGAHRTTAALEKVPQASRVQCEANAERIKAWQPKASTLCIEGLGSP
tara:strand:+ start:446 stop:634 length:189 start_codon:yes stop_codon:yes gene_type:complete